MRKPNYLLIFTLVIGAYIAMSFMAAAMEGPTGGIFGQKELYGLSADVWIFQFMVPLFLLPIFFVNGFESKLFGTVSIAYIAGASIEDFFWFVVNPFYGIGKWNSASAPWLDWINLGLFEIPLGYILSALASICLWFVFFSNAERVNSLFKKYLPISWLA